MKVDLHLHTSYSDSSLSLRGVLQLAKQRGLDQVSITDHDHARHWPLIQEICLDLDLDCVIGIEISAMEPTSRRKVHILGYDFDPAMPNISRLCQPLLKRRHDRSLEQMRLLEANGLTVPRQRIEELAAESGVIYKQHIMQALTETGQADGVAGQVYHQYFKGDGVCAGDIEYIPVLDAIRAIKQDGGLAVLAHPGESKVYDLIQDLIDAGLDGIERNHPSHQPLDERLIDTFDLPTTGGSDFHADFGKVDCLGQILSPHYIRDGRFQVANPVLTKK